jgi:hypothetical protein
MHFQDDGSLPSVLPRAGDKDDSSKAPLPGKSSVQQAARKAPALVCSMQGHDSFPTLPQAIQLE